MERYKYIYSLITALNDQRYLKMALRKELNKHQNCITQYSTCDQECKACPYYENKWEEFKYLIDRLPSSQVKMRLITVIALNKTCPQIIKLGECKGDCEYCHNPLVTSHLQWEVKS